MAVRVLVGLDQELVLDHLPGLGDGVLARVDAKARAERRLEDVELLVGGERRDQGGRAASLRD